MHVIGAPLKWLCKQAGAEAMQQPVVAQHVLHHLSAIPETHEVLCTTLAQAGVCMQIMQARHAGERYPTVLHSAAELSLATVVAQVRLDWCRPSEAVLAWWQVPLKAVSHLIWGGIVTSGYFHR
jgi:hypothetical protein